MKAIQTKYLPPTDTKPARVKAFDCSGNSITIAYDYNCGTEVAQYFNACAAFIEKYKWDWPKSRIVSGATKDGYVFCCKPRH